MHLRSSNHHLWPTKLITNQQVSIKHYIQHGIDQTHKNMHRTMENNPHKHRISNNTTQNYRIIFISLYMFHRVLIFFNIHHYYLFKIFLLNILCCKSNCVNKSHFSLAAYTWWCWNRCCINIIHRYIIILANWKFCKHQSTWFLCQSQFAFNCKHQSITKLK